MEGATATEKKEQGLAKQTKTDKTTKKEKKEKEKPTKKEKTTKKLEKEKKLWRSRAYHWRWQARSLNDQCELLLNLCEAWRAKYERERDGELMN